MLYGYTSNLGCNSCSNNLIPQRITGLKPSLTPQNLHPYVYVTNNPVNLVDPLGLCECDRAKCLEDYNKCVADAINKMLKEIFRRGLYLYFPETIILTGSGMLGLGTVGGLIGGIISTAHTFYDLAQLYRGMEKERANCRKIIENCCK